MTVHITMVNSNWAKIGAFEAKDNKSIAQIAKDNGIEIPTSCCHGACFICNCKIKKGEEYIQIDKIMPPSILPKRDNEGKREEVFACVWWVKSDYINAAENYEITLEKDC